MTEIIKQKIVLGCKNPSQTVYIAVMHYGVRNTYMDYVSDEQKTFKAYKQMKKEFQGHDDE